MQLLKVPLILAPVLIYTCICPMPAVSRLFPAFTNINLYRIITTSSAVTGTGALPWVPSTGSYAGDQDIQQNSPAAELGRTGNPQAADEDPALGGTWPQRECSIWLSIPQTSGPVAVESPGTQISPKNWRCVAHNDRRWAQGGSTVTTPLTPILMKWFPLLLAILTLSKET